METKEIFERMADGYDTPERADTAKIIAGEMRNALADDASGKAAMDYGCGTGLVGLQLLGDFKSMLFVDNSPNMISRLSQKIDEAGLNASGDKARALCADLAQEQLQTEQVDYILVSQVLLHIRDVPLILKRLCGLLKPGGHLLVADFDHNPAVQNELVHPGFVQHELIQTAVQAGFRTASAHTFHHGEGIFMKQNASLFLLDAEK